MICKWEILTSGGVCRIRVLYHKNGHVWLSGPCKNTGGIRKLEIEGLDSNVYYHYVDISGGYWIFNTDKILKSVIANGDYYDL